MTGSKLNLLTPKATEMGRREFLKRSFALVAGAAGMKMLGGCSSDPLSATQTVLFERRINTSEIVEVQSLKFKVRSIFNPLVLQDGRRGPGALWDLVEAPEGYFKFGEYLLVGDHGQVMNERGLWILRIELVGVEWGGYSTNTWATFRFVQIDETNGPYRP